MVSKNINELVALAKQGNEKAFESIMKKLEPFIYKNVHSIYVKGYDDDDLKQLCYMALMRAIDKFDLDKNSNFTSYAMISIKNALNYLVRRKHRNNEEISINTPIGDGIKLEDCLVSECSIEDDLIKKEAYALISKACSKLSPKEKELLKFILKGRGGLLEYSKKYATPYSTCFKRKARLIDKIKKMV